MPVVEVVGSGWLAGCTVCPYVSSADRPLSRTGCFGQQLLRLYDYIHAYVHRRIIYLSRPKRLVGRLRTLLWLCLTIMIYLVADLQKPPQPWAIRKEL